MNNKLNSIYRMLAVIVILALTLIMTGCDTEYVQSQIQNSVNDYLEGIESDLNVSSEVNSSYSSNDTFGGVSSSGGSNNSSSPAAVGSSSSNTSSGEKQNNPISSEVIEDFHENIQSQDPEPEEPEEVTPVIDPGFSGGDGTENNPYIITTAKELVYFSEKINKGELNNGVYFALGADIDMTDVDFFPIGNSSHRFSSYFDGRGFTVSNLTPKLRYDDFGNNGNYSCGFFGIVKNAEIKNLRLENVNITHSYSSYYFSEAGILAAAVHTTKECKITDCYVSGNINFLTDVLLVGGVVGYVSTTNEANFICERVQSNTKMQVNLGAVNAGAVLGSLSGGGEEIFSDICAESEIEHNSNFKAYIGAFGGVSKIMGNMRVSNCFFKINTKINPNDEIHPIIGGIIDSSNPNGTFEFTNVFGFVKNNVKLYEIPAENPVTEINCSVTKALPTTCNFDTEIWDITNPAAPFIKFNFEKN